MKTVFKLAEDGREIMGSKTQYRTRHRDELLEYMEQVADGHFTVHDVCEYFRGTGRTIGTTTVYRQLEKMVDEGLVAKYIIDANSAACFEYLGKRDHCHEEICFHCKCERCGKLIHLHCEELLGIRAHLEEDHGFRLTSTRTVLYGLCEDCRAEEADAR